MKQIITDRLVLRSLSVNDAEAVFSWGKDPRVNKTVIYPLYSNIEDVKKWLSTVKESDNEFLITLKDGTPIGSCGLGFDKSFNAYNIGYNLHYDYWGKGYGSEAAKALLDWGIKQGYKEFVARHFDGNEKSKKIILSLGFKFEKFIDFNKIGETKPIKSLIYRLHL